MIVQISILTALGLTLGLSIIFIVRSFKMKNKWIKTTNELKKQKEDNEFLNKKLQIAIEDLKLKRRNGFYSDTLILLSTEQRKNNEKGEPYNYIVYVTELDKYTNGLSKIKLDRIEIISGFDCNEFNWVRESVEKKFASIKKTSEIEWLENEENVKDMRKEKLDRIKNLKND
jgi:hypothetical protein